MAKNKASKKILFIAGAVLCCIFALMLVCNLTIIIKGVINPETPPSVFGVTPMVVQSGSMSGSAEDHIEVGDLIFTVKPNTAELKKGDIISFMEGDIAVTHRIVDVTTDANGKRSFITKGDANNTEDPAVGEDAVFGLYKGRIPGLGDFAMIRKPRSLNPSLNGSVPLREKRTPKKKTAAKHNKRYLPRNRCHSRTKR